MNTQSIWRGISAAVCFAAAICANAMPTEAEIAKVTPLVEELVKSDLAALKAGRKSPDQVAETIVGYVKDAESEAAKYVLLEKAFSLYLDSGETKKAINLCGMFARHVPEVPQGPLDERIGLAFAAKGQWNYAFIGFGKAGGKMAEIVEWEKAYPATGVTELTTDAVGDFWWEMSEKYADNPKVAAALRAHAAKWLKEAIKNNSLRGLKKTLAEKRIAEVEKAGGRPVESPRPRAPEGIAKSDSTPERSQFTPSKAPQPPPRRLRVGRVTIDFVGCPAGEFMMGAQRYKSPVNGHFYHRVRISRPFWLSKYKVTHEMWNAYRKVKLTKEDQVLGGMKRVHCTTAQEADDFCEWLMKKCKAMLPSGYVVRLPTEAEWEYALRANVSDPGDPYLKAIDMLSPPFRLTPEYSDIAVFWEEVQPKLVKAKLIGDRERENEKIMGMEVGTKKPNAWGLYDMYGNLGERMLDRIDAGKLGRYNGSPFIGGTGGGAVDWGNQDAVRYIDGDVDPLNRVDEKKATYVSSLRRGGSIHARWHGTFRKVAVPHDDGPVGAMPLRLCIGPDLIKEKGYQKLKVNK